jgi:hypothetical protein
MHSNVGLGCFCCTHLNEVRKYGRGEPVPHRKELLVEEVAGGLGERRHANDPARIFHPKVQDAERGSGGSVEEPEAVFGDVAVVVEPNVVASVGAPFKLDRDVFFDADQRARHKVLSLRPMVVVVQVLVVLVLVPVMLVILVVLLRLLLLWREPFCNTLPAGQHCCC